MARITHFDFAGHEFSAIPPTALRGRGAVSNVPHRFEKAERFAVIDGHPIELAGAESAHIDAGADTASTLPAARTQVVNERAVKLISRNDSPDISFDRAVNPYRGCEHGCVYCYARPTHAYLGYSPGLDFETRLVAKVNAVQALRDEFSRPSYRVEPVNIGSATDVYQPIEKDYQLTRGLLELFLETGHPLTLVTKNAMVTRDIDLLAALARRNLVAVYISVTSLDNTLSRTFEPRASAPQRRLAAIRQLADAGVPVGVLVAPVIPFINDEFLERILEEAKSAGAYYANYTVIRMPWEVKAVFEEWLQAHFPDRAARVMHRIEDMREGKRNDARFGTRMRGTGIWAELLRQRFDIAVRRLELNRSRLSLDVSQFCAPARSRRAALSKGAGPDDAFASASPTAVAAAAPTPGSRGRASGVGRTHPDCSPSAPVTQLGLFD